MAGDPTASDYLVYFVCEEFNMTGSTSNSDYREFSYFVDETLDFILSYIGGASTEELSTSQKTGYVFKGWRVVPSNSIFNEVIVNVNDTRTFGEIYPNMTAENTKGMTVYITRILEPDITKTIFEKGALDIILNKIKNSKSGPTIFASGDTLTITN